jgi:CBS domain-containing protein
MSARAASRLETLGFTQVFRYTLGKQDWFAAGLPREGRLAGVPRAADAARTDVPTCGLTDRVGEVRERVRAAGWNRCLVVDEHRVVLGLLHGRGLAATAEMPAEEVMQPGPTTFRPNGALSAIVEWMHDRKVGSVVVTTSDGELLGVLFREDADRHLAEESTEETSTR